MIQRNIYIDAADVVHRRSWTDESGYPSAHKNHHILELSEDMDQLYEDRLAGFYFSFGVLPVSLPKSQTGCKRTAA
ncbi:MAG: hypothetical protein WCO26_23130, partial [Deltaproteobacteria bacterium]